MVASASQHGDRVFYVLQHFIEGNQIKTSDISGSHEIGANSVNVGKFPRMRHGTQIRIKSSAWPSRKLVQLIQKHTQAGTYVQYFWHGATSQHLSKMHTAKLPYPLNPAYIVRLSGAQANNSVERPLEAVRPIGRIYVSSVVESTHIHLMN